MVAFYYCLFFSFLSEFCLYLPCLYDYSGKFPARSTAYAKARKGSSLPFFCVLLYMEFVRVSFGMPSGFCSV